MGAEGRFFNIRHAVCSCCRAVAAAAAVSSSDAISKGLQIRIRYVRYVFSGCISLHFRYAGYVSHM